MPSGKTVKLVLLEAVQFSAVCAPLFVVMERFAGLVRDLKGGQGDRTAYWLVVAASVAYVTSATLLVWVPLKYLLLKRRGRIAKIKLWRPAALAYVILCPLPCFALLMAASKVQADGGQTLDHFSELPASLVLLCLIVVDVVERIRTCSLTGKSDSGPGLDFDMRGPVLTHLQHVSTVTGQHHHPDHKDTATVIQKGSESPSQMDTVSTTADATTTTTTTTIINGTPAPRRYLSDNPNGQSTPITRRSYLYPPPAPSGPLRLLWSSDVRAEAFADSFLFWLDTAEMLRVAADPEVFYSAWAFPVFIAAFLSCLRVAVSPRNPLGSCVGVALQDFPFLVLRVALLAAFGHLTPVLYAVKNLLVCLSYVYFTLLTRVLKRRSMF